MVGTAYHSLDVPALSAGLFALRRSHEPQKLPVHQTGSTPNNLENLKTPDDLWKVRLIEEDFHRLMFEMEGE